MSDSGLEFSIVSGDPTPEELAAVTAVIQALAHEREEEDSGGVRRGPSAWQRSQRATRVPLTPGFGAWRSFSA